MQGIYKIVNKINNKVYIGQSIIIDRRFKQHKKNVLNKKIRHPLYDSIRKYGIKNFEFIILEKVDITFLLDQREQYWLDYYKSYNPELGYNLCNNSISRKGYKVSDETKRKISEAKKGKKQTEEAKLKVSLFQKGKKKKPFTEEHKKKIGLPHKGKILSNETKQKIALARKLWWQEKKKQKIQQKNIIIFKEAI